ncbi:Leucine-rich repeat receptor-like protein kinase [Musa troglodytarum]|uniref:non-specific serine/threonine protein kinase n=1 Tax=Musa troglodytarum TaxID=320322 RepID=A0A9E7JV33_9LILI|nr:Leucine-rich repeat receptor-like protein kinase [Musa troglodytarum]
MKGGLLLLLMCFVCVRHGFSRTDPQDVYALKALSNQWKNTPPNWRHSDDPCGDQWDGVSCTYSRVKELKLFSMGIEGSLSGDIQNLTELTHLDLSFNKKLGGPLPPSIGNLKQLQTLRLINCNFGGRIPDEVGNLLNLTTLSLNSNNFTGRIPGSLGRLSNLNWLDLADNQLNGSLPTSSNGASGLDQLVNNLHFHLNLNQLSGPIPSDLFRSNMQVIHMLLDHNNFSEEIPESIGLAQSLKVLRLDVNSLRGSIPSSINNLTSLNVLNLGNNKLTGPMPNLTGMAALNYLNLSNNLFDPSEAPAWLLDVQNLTTLIIESGNLHGEVPQTLFSLPHLQEVRLNDNAFNGTLNMGSNISLQLEMVNFQNNNFASVTLSSNYNNTIILVGNPVCNNRYLQETKFCRQEQDSPSYSPEVNCSHPYEGPITCRAPSFSDQSINTSQLEERISTVLHAFPVSHSLQNHSFDVNAYLVVELKICHQSAKFFTRNETLQWFDLSTQNLDLPLMYGPCVFNPRPYTFHKNVSLAWIIGTAVGCAAAVFIIAGLGFYALRQKKQAKTAINLNNPFASWGSTGEDAGDAPHIKLARCFSLDELRKFTDGFSVDNEIGSGGYGKVYKGMLSDGQMVAIKRSQKGSMQGGLEFKTEIEMLSRVHHKNLVELVGFCFEKGERTLVYEYISNGTLTKNLSGRSHVKLDWKQRLNIALDSARGLAYLHELAKPPIIHRDVKSTNILLDDNLSAKVADFGLSTLILDSDHGHVSTNVKGTLGYLDPEYFMTQQLTTKSDVYSFGVVMLELITARLPIEKGKYIVREVKMAMDKNDKEYYGLRDIIDPAILNAGSLIGFQRFVELALQCLEDASEDRPTMNDIVKEIEVLSKDNRLEANSISASSSATYFGNARGASEQPYDEMPISSEVNSGVYGSDNYLLSQ